jgi:hypothetical protein
VAARWPPLIVGLKIESVHELGCLSSAQAKRVLSKRDATDRAQRRLVLGFGVDRSGDGRGGQARTVNTERQAQWTRINYGPLARVVGQARRVPLGKGEMEWSHVAQEPSSAELQARVKMRGRRGKVSRGLSEDPAARPATQRHCR